jgi:hypothetical protein
MTPINKWITVWNNLLAAWRLMSLDKKNTTFAADKK